MEASHNEEYYGRHYSHLGYMPADFSVTNAGLEKELGMRKKKWILNVSAVLALAAAAVFFIKWNPEELLRNAQKPVTQKEILKKEKASYTGSRAGADIPRLSGEEEFKALIYNIDYVTVETAELIPTGVFQLKSWVDPYVKKNINHRVTKTGKRKSQTIKSKINFQPDYNQFYLVKLPDESYILAQIPEQEVERCKREKFVTLPIGVKTGITKTAEAYLADICGEYGASLEGVLYTFDNEWYQKHNFVLLLLRFGVSFVLYIAVAFVFVMIGNRIFKIEKCKGDK